jgi:transcriptional regulator of arginine metabolism
VNRNERHAAIQRLVRDQPLSTQTELAEALRAEGHEVVQTTVSRDIHELGLIKVRHESGRLVYAFPEDDGAYSEELSDALKRWALTLEPSGNLVVVGTPYGYASALAQAIDVARHPHIAGSVAGENTVLLISREPVTGADLAAELQAQRLPGAA